jgi:hypothetical protein
MHTLLLSNRLYVVFTCCRGQRFVHVRPINYWRIDCICGCFVIRLKLRPHCPINDGFERFMTTIVDDGIS